MLLLREKRREKDLWWLRLSLMAEVKEESKSSSEESVKLFVGQVPKSMTEDEVLAMFKDFALVDEVNVIRDKVSRASRGSNCPQTPISIQIQMCVVACFGFVFLCSQDAAF